MYVQAGLASPTSPVIEHADVAFLKVEFVYPDWTPLCFGYSDRVGLAKRLFVVGHINEGRAVPAEGLLVKEMGPELAYWQVDMRGIFGLSGAPVFNDYGEVVGLVAEERQIVTSRSLSGTQVVPERLFRDLRLNFMGQRHCEDFARASVLPPTATPCRAFKWLPCAKIR